MSKQPAKQSEHELYLPSETCVINIYDTCLLTEARTQGRYIYIGRSGNDVESPWGNPFSHKDSSFALHRTSSLHESLTRFEDHLLTSSLITRIEELHGKVLGCFCASPGRYLTADRPWVCHGQIYCHYLDLMGD